MPRAQKFVPPELVSTGILAKATADNNWSANDAQVAQQWYEHFLELRYQQPNKPLFVMAQKADQLWHVHINDFNQDYVTYCTNVIGQVLTHTTLQPPHTPTPQQTQDATNRYNRWGPIPDATTCCY